MNDQIAAEPAVRTDSLYADLARTWDALAGLAEGGAARAHDGAEPEAETGTETEAETDTGAAARQPDAPEHWPAEWRTRLEALDGQARDCVLDLHRQLEEAHSVREDALAAREKRLDGLAALEEALVPYRDELARAGVSQAEALGSLAAAHGLLLRDPAAGLRWIAGAYGVDPGALAAAPPPPAAPPVPVAPPAPADDGAAVASPAPDRRAQAAWEQRRIDAMEARLAALARARGPDGAPRFPHFDAVRPQMAALMDTGAATSFEDAYDRAVWADPVLRQAALEARDTDAARARETARRADLARARRTGRGVQGTSEPAAAGPPPARSHREELERVWDRMVAD